MKKICSKCKEYKDLEDFGKYSKMKDGLNSVCKICCRKRDKKAKQKDGYIKANEIYKEAHKKEMNKYGKTYRKENVEKVSKKNKKHYEENKKHYEGYRKENKENKKEYDKKRLQTANGKAKDTEKSGKRRALKAGTSINNTPHENYLIECIYAFSRFKSETTGIPQHVDHVIPLSKGGLHNPSNMQILTATANMSKGAKLIA